MHQMNLYFHSQKDTILSLQCLSLENVILLFPFLKRNYSLYEKRLCENIIRYFNDKCWKVEKLEYGISMIGDN